MLAHGSGSFHFDVLFAVGRTRADLSRWSRSASRRLSQSLANAARYCCATWTGADWSR